MGTTTEDASNVDSTKADLAYLRALCRTVPYHIVQRVTREPAERSVGDSHFVGATMFCDLVGFTALCDNLASGGPSGLDRLSELLNRLFGEILSDAVFPYAGDVVQFGGDSITTVFRGHDAARRAMAAGLTCIRLLHGELGRLLEGKKQFLQMRIGIAYGPIALPVLGDYVRRLVVAAGPCAHRALALQQEAKPNEIIVDTASLAEVGHVADVVERKDTHAILRGLKEWPQGLPPEPEVPDLNIDTAVKIRLLEPFVPKPLAERLRTAPLDRKTPWRIAGEVRHVVVLFAEITGFDRTADQDKALGDDPALMELQETARNVARSLMRSYRKYGGIISKGDLTDSGHRIMVLFGLHMPAENDAERAVLAALEASERMQGYVGDRFPNLSIKTGIHAGRVYFGAIGSDLKHDITVIGDTVNIAARAGGAAKTYEVLVTAPVNGAIADDFAREEREPIIVKGKTSGLRLFAIHGRPQGSAHFIRSRRQDRFYAGRTKELQRFEAMVDGCLVGDGRVIGICGEAGTGKSRTISHIVERWIAGGGIGSVGRCLFSTKSVPLAPVAAMFANFLGLSPEDSDQQRWDRIQEGLGPFAIDAGTPELMALLQPVHRPDGSMEVALDFSDAHARERVMRAILDFLQQRLRQDAPVLYVLEDLQYADTLTLELLQRVRDISRETSFLMVATYRPDPILNDFRGALDEEIQLYDFSLGDSTRLISHQCGADSVDSDLAVFLWQRSGGNPGYLTELVRFVDERRLLTIQGGQVRPRGEGLSLLDGVVPRNLAQMTLTRIDALGVIERQLLRMAAVMGRRFSHRVLRAMAGEVGSDEEVETALGGLRQKRLLMTSSHAPDGYMFRDDVVRAVTYGTIPEAEKAKIHGAIAQAIESAGEKDSQKLPAVLARHWERAGDFGKAMKAYYRAMGLALRAGLFVEASGFVERWQRCAFRTDANERPSAALQAKVALLNLVAIARQGAAARTIRAGREVAANHWQALDARGRAVVDYWTGEAMMLAGQHDNARERLERVYKQSKDESQRSDAARLLARSYELGHHTEEARRWLDKAEASAGGDQYRLLRIKISKANVAGDQGHLDEAIATYREVCTETRRSDLLDLDATALTNLSACLLLKEDIPTARRGFEEAIHKQRILRYRSDESLNTLNIGQTYLWEADYPQAKRWLEKGRSLALELGESATVAEVDVYLSFVLAHLGQGERAVQRLQKALDAASQAQMHEAVVAGRLFLLHLAVHGKAPSVAGDLVALHQSCLDVRADIEKFPLFLHFFQPLHEHVNKGEKVT